MLSTKSSPLVRYGVAVLASLLALLLRFLLKPVLGNEAPLLIFIMPVMASAWYGGFGPGLLATACSSLIGTYFFVLPLYALSINDLGNAVRVGIFIIEGLLISWLNEALIGAKQRAEKTTLSLAQEKAISDLERKRLRAVLDLLPVGVAIADRRGKVLHVNPSFKAIWGQTAPLVTTIDAYGEYKGWWSSTGDRLTPEAWALARALQDGEVSINEEIDIESFDGERKTILNSAVPIRDETGAIANAVVVNFEITQRKQQQEALRRAAARLEALHEIDLAILAAQSSVELARSALKRMRALIGTEQALVVLYDFETSSAQVLVSNAAGNLHPLEQTILPLGNLIPENATPSDPTSSAEAISWYQECPSILKMLNPSLGTHCLRIPLLVENQLMGELMLFNDRPSAFNAEEREIATEVANQLAIAIQQARLREQLQAYTDELEQRVIQRTAALEEANLALEAFAYSISHDLRAPLRAIEGFAQALAEDYTDLLDVEGRDFIHRIVTSTQRMNLLIQDLLNYSRLSRTQLNLRSLDLDGVVTEVLTQLAAEIEAKQAIVTVDRPLPNVIGHRAIVVQALVNLVFNGIKFVSPEVQPQVRIWAELIRGDAEPHLHPTSTDVRLWVEDNGIGIESQYLERIFQVFERLHGEEAYPGTGIGLAIVRKGIERLGGRVGVESQVGQGSRFWIELPAA